MEHNARMWGVKMNTNGSYNKELAVKLRRQGTSMSR